MQPEATSTLFGATAAPAVPGVVSSAKEGGRRRAMRLATAGGRKRRSVASRGPAVTAHPTLVVILQARKPTPPSIPTCGGEVSTGRCPRAPTLTGRRASLVTSRAQAATTACPCRPFSLAGVGSRSTVAGLTRVVCSKEG